MMTHPTNSILVVSLKQTFYVSGREPLTGANVAWYRTFTCWIPAFISAWIAIFNSSSIVTSSSPLSWREHEACNAQWRFDLSFGQITQRRQGNQDNINNTWWRFEAIRFNSEQVMDHKLLYREAPQVVEASLSYVSLRETSHKIQQECHFNQPCTLPQDRQPECR